MLKDFDVDRKARREAEAATVEDRTFTLGGQTFIARTQIHPSVLVGYDRIGPETSISDTLSTIDDTILKMIETGDDAHSRYMDVRANTDDVVTIEDLIELVKWLMEVVTGRPTGLLSDSGSGQTTTATPSTDDSSSTDTPKASSS